MFIEQSCAHKRHKIKISIKTDILPLNFKLNTKTHVTHYIQDVLVVQSGDNIAVKWRLHVVTLVL